MRFGAFVGGLSVSFALRGGRAMAGCCRAWLFVPLPVKCDHCDNPATVHEVTIQGGVKVEKHLCEQCAKQHGSGLPSQPPITQLLSQYVAAQSQVGQKAGVKARGAGVCGSCGTTYAQFRHTGLLGCPECYAAFESQLGPLLARAHEGLSHHVGKIPRRRGGGGGERGLGDGAEPGPGADPAEQRGLAGGGGQLSEASRRRIQVLKRQLREALAAEQYERAATLRDELRRVGLEATQRGTGEQDGGEGEGGDDRNGGAGEEEWGR